MWYLTEYKGKLAVSLGWSPDHDNPIERRDLWVHPTEKWNEDYYSQFTQVRLIENGYFRCFSSLSYSEKNLYTEGWEYVQETRPIKPPGRGGKDWSWAWNWGHWIKSYH